MPDTTIDGQTHRNNDVSKGVRKRMLQVGFTILIQAAILFASSGRLDWVMAWVYIGVGVGIVAINTAIIVPRNPELIAERGQIKENTKSWDKVLVVLYGIFSLATLIVAGIDVRMGWTEPIASMIELVALAFYAFGYGLASWAMASNKFFSSAVRIQKERGHTVATAGPYQYVRHPGYAGMIIAWIATPLSLGSLFALIPAGLMVFIFIARTVLEDRTLQDELNGYKDYAKRVRYRLVPGIW